MNPPDYNSIYQAGDNMINQLSRHAMQTQAIKYKLQQAAQEAAVRNMVAQAQVENYKAQTGKHKAETEDITSRSAGRKMASESVANIIGLDEQGRWGIKTDPESQRLVGQFMSGTVATGKTANDIANALKNASAGLNTVPEMDRKSASAAAVARIGAEAKVDIANSPTPKVLSAGGMLVNPDGSIVSNPSASMAPKITETYKDVVTPADVTPATKGFFGFGAKPAVTNAPASTNQVLQSRTITRPLTQNSAPSESTNATVSTPESIREAVRAGKMDKAEAARILREQFGFK